MYVCKGAFMCTLAENKNDIHVKIKLFMVKRDGRIATLQLA